MPPLILNPTANDLRKTLSPRYLDTINQAWSDLAIALSNSLDNYADQPRRLLTQVRDFTTTDNQTLLNTINMLGLDYDAGLYQRTVNNTNVSVSPSGECYRRLVQGLGEFRTEKGTPSFIDFIGYFLNIELTMVPLWTLDFKTFVPLSQVPDELNTLNYATYVPGQYYPTSYVGLTYDGFAVYELPYADVNPTDIQTLFYKLAPIHLVLDWIASIFNTDTNLYVAAVNLARSESTSANQETWTTEYIGAFTLDKAEFSTPNQETWMTLFMGVTTLDVGIFTTSNIAIDPNFGVIYIAAATTDTAEFTSLANDCAVYDIVDPFT
jgi:hypothetical protein